ncbi:MAG TPA: hypothetical protein VKW06_09650 [Candidatus Angelobacter sp.]|nr:hypothetical protein [Candidatus Angelobacter sp.]
MQLRRHIEWLLVLVVLAYCAPGSAQRTNIASLAHGASAQGQLTVTLTVVASTGIVIDAAGEPRLIMANAAAEGDNVSRLQSSHSIVVKKTLQPSREVLKTKHNHAPSISPQ